MKTACKPKILAILLIVVTYVNSEYVKVTTNKGQLLGETVETELGKKVDVWRSIPYAKPPVGELRFKHPISNDPWTGVLNVTQNPNMCYQDVKNNKFLNIIYKELYAKQTPSEDCLYLSVVAPNPKPKDAAVLVWIHGISNAGSYSDPRFNFNVLSAHGDIIIVAVQYRLSAFGFLYGRNPEIPGNAGIYDQLMALQWVHNNIKKFGGNPKRVTIAGQQIGSSYAALHISSPISSKFISQAILQSGAHTKGTFPDPLLYGVSKSIVDSVNCSVHTTINEDVARCLRSVDAAVLAEKTPAGWLKGVRDGKLIPFEDFKEQPDNIGRKKNVLVGSNRNEGSFIMAELSVIYDLSSDGIVERLPDMNSQSFKDGINILISIFPKRAKDLLYYNYMNWDDPENSTALEINMNKFYADFLHDCDIDYFVDIVAKHNWNIYRYLFNYRSGINLYPEWLGVYTGIELDFEFGLPSYREINATEEDKKMSKLFMDYLSNFIKTGNPNVYNEEQSCKRLKWAKYTVDEPGYMEMAGDKTTFHNKWPLNKDCILWKDFLFDDDDDDESMCGTNDIIEEIDPNTIEPNKILTISKFTMTNIINPNSEKFNKINEKMEASSAIHPFLGFPSEAKTKTNTTTKFSKNKNSWTMTQESRSYTDIIE